MIIPPKRKEDRDMLLHERAVALVLPGPRCDDVRAELLRSASALEATADEAEATAKAAGDPTAEEAAHWRAWRETAACLRRMRDAVPSLKIEEEEPA